MVRSRRYREERPAAPAAEPREAPGVTYAEDAAYPGLKLFRCDPLRATMTMKGCGKRWTEAQEAHLPFVPADRRTRPGAAGPAIAATRAALEVCRSCAIGAAHANSSHVQYSKIYGASICPRCLKGATRMIGGRTCVSCYNRARELASGKNARGNAPVELQQRAPHPIELRLVVDGVASRSSATGVAMAEVVVQTLRTTRGDVAFAFQGADLAMSQGRLF